MFKLFYLSLISLANTPNFNNSCYIDPNAPASWDYITIDMNQNSDYWLNHTGTINNYADLWFTFCLNIGNFYVWSQSTRVIAYDVANNLNTYLKQAWTYHKLTKWGNVPFEYKFKIHYELIKAEIIGQAYPLE